MIEVICGPIFSGKTEELIRRIRRLQYAEVDFMLFKPTIDDRYHEINITSHNKTTIKSIPIQYASEITLHLDQNPHITTIAIDEVQFLHPDIVGICNNLDPNYHILVAGLDMNHKGEPFAVMQGFLPIADTIEKLSAVCVKCGHDAKMSYKISQDAIIVDVGGAEKYEARCRKCWASVC